MKKIISSFLLSVAILLSNGIPVSAQEVTTSSTEITTVEEQTVTPRKVDTAGEIALSSGDDFSVEFTMKGILGMGTTHNAFKVVISDITKGNCKVTITGDDGYSYVSDYAGNRTITTRNAKPDVKYTVTIMGNTTYGCRGKYAITSYIE